MSMFHILDGSSPMIASAHIVFVSACSTHDSQLKHGQVETWPHKHDAGHQHAQLRELCSALSRNRADIASALCVSTLISCRHCT